jgi:hypothetical protein
VLNDTEEVYLTRKLNVQLSGLDPRAALSALLPPDCMALIRILQYSGQYATEAIRVCSADRWSHDPPWLVLLLDLLPKESETQRIQDKLRTPPDSGADPHASQVLITGEPFVNRGTFRQKARSLALQVTPRPILIVLGDRKTGKTYTTQYVRHLQLSVASFEYVKVTLAEGSGLAWGPRELAINLLTDMGVDVKALAASLMEPTTNAERWPYELAGIVLNEGLKLTKRFWIVLDNFRGAELRADTGKLIVALAQRIADSSLFGGSYRLVLLGFDPALLTIPQSVFDTDKIQPFTDSDVRAAIVEIASKNLLTLTVPEQDALLAKILDGLPQDDSRWSELYARLTDLPASIREAVV